MKAPAINITKASGEQALFDAGKLRQSLRRSRAGDDLIDAVIAEVQSKLVEGMPTKKIYQLAFSLIRKKSKHTAARYKLKRAIMELGPTGFPFEKFVSEILKQQGYRVKVDVVVQGHCVSHEIDVIAEKENHRFMIECKFHNAIGIKCDVKTPLYIQARFHDVERKWKDEARQGPKFHQGWVVTNTKFTADAIQFGLCAGLQMIGWDFPKGKSLREEIDASGLYPVTCLTTLTHYEKQLLLNEGIILSRELCSNPQLLDTKGISPNRREAILNEAVSLCEKAGK